MDVDIKNKVHEFTKPLVGKGYNWQWNKNKSMDSNGIFIWHSTKVSLPQEILVEEILDGTTNLVL